MPGERGSCLMPLVIIRSHNVTHIAQTPTTRGSRIGQRDVRVSGMATLKGQIDAICKALELTEEGGLIAQVKAAAESCGLRPVAD